MSRGDVIIALDFPSAEAVYAFLDKFENEARKPYVKVGMELFYAEGPQIVREIKARGHKIFLDLKLHDIPNTVKEAGLDGVVCSPLEAGLVKEACGAAFQTVTPGIRFADSAADDQARVMTPEKARLGGSDYIVVGRPITQAADPVAAYRRCVKEFLGE